jgi:hypothetical protein
MASVPGPNPDRPFPPPGAPAERPDPEHDEEERRAADPAQPEWVPEPYDPDHERVEPALPAAVP